MAITEAENIISISDASNLGISTLIREVEEGCEWIVTRHGKAVAVVTNMERLERLKQLEDDLVDIMLVACRMATTSADRYSLDEVLSRFGYTRDDLGNTPA